VIRSHAGTFDLRMPNLAFPPHTQPGIHVLVGARIITTENAVADGVTIGVLNANKYLGEK